MRPHASQPSRSRASRMRTLPSANRDMLVEKGRDAFERHRYAFGPDRGNDRFLSRRNSSRSVCSCSYGQVEARGQSHRTSSFASRLLRTTKCVYRDNTRIEQDAAKQPPSARIVLEELQYRRYIPPMSRRAIPAVSAHDSNSSAREANATACRRNNRYAAAASTETSNHRRRRQNDRKESGLRSASPLKAQRQVAAETIC